MLLMIDNYDSFTFNLVQYFCELGEEVKVVRNNEVTLDEVAAFKADRIVLSPGPCSPAEAGVCVPLPECLEITSWTDDGEIMGVRHKGPQTDAGFAPLEGVQFHPESILSEHGHAMLANFLKM
jgi:anthranilate/para-aminobenzoate synthase component II